MKREILKKIMFLLGVALVIYGAYAVVTALRPLNVGQFIWGVIGIVSGVFAIWMYLTKP